MRRSVLAAAAALVTLWPSSAIAQEPSTVQLADGVTCLFAGGATFVVGRDRANYLCDDGRWIVGGAHERPDGSILALTVNVVDCTDRPQGVEPCVDALEIVDVASW